jgi:3-deoxy-D-manno-octulosonate 8-phosphate phosphatase (KDO 8-P phosphatase)
LVENSKARYTEDALLNKMAGKIKANLAEIQLLVLDVDGVLTDGTLTVNADGSESKNFSVLDGHGIKLWKRAGFKIAFLSGRVATSTEHHARRLEVDYCLQDCRDKLPALKKLLKEAKLAPQAVAYIGDDLPDLPPMRYVGFAVAVPNAVDEVKQHADFVTTRTGGSGAVREVVEYILKSTGKWDKLMERYLK